MLCVKSNVRSLRCLAIGLGQARRARLRVADLRLGRALHEGADPERGQAVPEQRVARRLEARAGPRRLRWHGAAGGALRAQRARAAPRRLGRAPELLRFGSAPRVGRSGSRARAPPQRGGAGGVGLDLHDALPRRDGRGRLRRRRAGGARRRQLLRRRRRRRRRRGPGGAPAADVQVRLRPQAPPRRRRGRGGGGGAGRAAAAAAVARDGRGRRHRAVARGAPGAAAVRGLRRALVRFSAPLEFANVLS